MGELATDIALDGLPDDTRSICASDMPGRVLDDSLSAVLCYLATVSVAVANSVSIDLVSGRT